MDSKKLDSTIMIFVITILGYGMACLYQMGFKDFYHLPHQMIEINTSTISIVVITIGGFMIFGLLNSLFFTTNTDLKGAVTSTYNKIFKKENQDEISPRTRNLLAGIPVLGLMALLILNTQNVITLLELRSKYLIIGIVLFILYAIIKKYSSLSLAGIAIFMGVMFYQVGYNQAVNQKEYLTIKGTDFIVVDYKGDKAIVSKADFKKKIIYPEYQFIKLESSKLNEQQFELKHTGSLKMKD
ncbi:hypothetical protein [Bacillus thuringiensis]|uniref:hypothetical protein n=2 Tax=Bacillus thuringiensis TaxID=1428 RepID=UPI000BF5C9C1|nr:hypothetical protein [Bacillus thuringiensis]PFS10868.1 hypothetical protein COK45_31215 [Bacillus thuringiensis]